MSTKYLNLDAVVPNIDLVVELGGIKHRLVPVSVDDFVMNTKMMQELSKREIAGDIDEAAQVERQITILKDMLARSFPTLTPDMIGKLTLLQLRQLQDFALANNGTEESESEAQAQANPLEAGK